MSQPGLSDITSVASRRLLGGPPRTVAFPLCRRCVSGCVGGMQLLYDFGVFGSSIFVVSFVSCARSLMRAGSKLGGQDGMHW